MQYSLGSDIRPAARTVVALTFHGLLTIAGIMMAKAARDAVCLTVYLPRQIAVAEVAAVVAIAMTIGVQARVLRHVSLRSFLRGLPIVFALGDIVLSASFGALPPRLFGALAYLWVGLQASLLAPLVPVVSALSLSIQQAARVCGIIGAGTTIGWIVGGVMTAALAAHGGVARLLLVAGVFTVSSTLAAFMLPRADQATSAVDPIAGAGLWRRVRGICSSSSLRPLALLALVASTVTTIVALQFKLVASAPSQSTAMLARLLGHITLVTGCTALLVQVLAAARIVRTFDLRVALLVTPCVLALGAVSTLATGSLLAVVMLRGTDQVFRYTVDRAGIDLLYRQMSPGEILEHRPFIDSVISRVGDAVGSLFVLGIVAASTRPVVWLCLLALLLLVVWAVLACVAVRNHREELRSLLRVPPSISVPRPTSLRPWLTAA